MYLKPPIPRMNSPGLSIEYHQPKGCTIVCSPFSMLTNLIKEETLQC